MSLNLEVDGLDEAIQGMSVIVTGLPGFSIDALAELAQQIADFAAHLAPFRTGALQASIGLGDVGADYVSIDAAVHYAGFVEFGTRYMRAQPYLLPAVEAMKDKYAGILFSKVAFRTA